MKKDICDQRVIEKEEHLFADLEGIEYLVDTGAQMTSTIEPIQFTDNILIQAYNGKIEKEQIGEKFSIKMIKGSENLLAENFLQFLTLMLLLMMTYYRRIIYLES